MVEREVGGLGHEGFVLLEVETGIGFLAGEVKLFETREHFYFKGLLFDVCLHAFAVFGLLILYALIGKGLALVLVRVQCVYLESIDALF